MRIIKYSKNKIILNMVFSILTFGFILFGCVNNRQEYPENKKQEAMAQMYAQYKQDLFPEILDVSVKGLNEFPSQSLLFIDIRDKKEQDVSMIPGAITQQEFEANIEQYKNKIIIAYCTIGNRSGKYIKSLKPQGLEAYNLVGGILAWAWANNQLVDSNGLTKKVHVYGPQWNLLPDDYISVY